MSLDLLEEICSSLKEKKSSLNVRNVIGNKENTKKMPASLIAKTFPTDLLLVCEFVGSVTYMSYPTWTVNYLHT